MSKLSTNIEHAYFLAPEKLRFPQSKPPHTCGIRHVKENVLCQPGYVYSMMKGLFLCFSWLIVDSISWERREVSFCLLVCPCARLIKTETELKSMLSLHRINSKRAKKIVCGNLCLWTVTYEQLT